MLHLVLAALLAGAPGVPVQLPKLNRGSHNSRNVALRVCPGGCGANLQGSLGEGVTFTRASAWTCPNADGTIQQLSSGSPCLVQNVTGGPSAGFRARPSVVNLLQYDHSIGTSPWATENLTCALPTVTLASTDLTDPAGGTNATKVGFSACSGTNNTAIYQTYTGSVAAYSGGLYARTLSGSYSFDIYNSLGGSSGGVARCNAVATQWTLCAVNNTTETVATWNFAAGYLGATAGATAISAGTVYLYGAETALGATLPDLCQTAGATGTCVDETVVTTAIPAGLGTSFCISADAQSVSPTTYRAIFGSGVGLAANTWVLAFNSGAGLSWQVEDNSAATKTWPGTATITAGFHHVRVCYDGAGDAPLLWLDGAAVAAGTAVGAGTGVLASQAAIDVGNYQRSGYALGGSAGNFCLGNCGAGPSGIAACSVCP